MNAFPQSDHETMAAEAAEWFVDSLDGLTAANRAQFEGWLNASPAHAEEFMAIAQLVQELPAAVADDPALSIEALTKSARAENERSDRPVGRQVGHAAAHAPRNRWQFAAAAALAGIAALGMVLLSANRLMPAPVLALHFATQHGEQLTQRLADDSVLHLNTDTSVNVRFERGGRSVNIERGQVVFEVAHDASRPFRVFAGSLQVVDLGTKFDVYLQPQATQVTVLEGRVMVERIPQWPGGGATAGGAQEAKSIFVDAGQQVQVLQGRALGRPTTVDAKRATAWLQHQIAFEREPLGRVALEFNRYAKTPIEIETPALRERLISGVFSENDTDSFIAFLRSLRGVRVEATSTRIQVFGT